MFRQNHIYRHSKAHFEWDDFVRFREMCNINITEVKNSDGLWSICICQKIGYPKTHWIIIMHPIHMLLWMHPMFEQTHLLGRFSRRLICTLGVWLSNWGLCGCYPSMDHWTHWSVARGCHLRDTGRCEWTMFWDVLGIFAGVDVGMDQYLLIPFLGGYSHPFTSYFDVHQGYKVLTHCHVDANVEKWCLRRTVTQYWCEQEIYLTWF